MITIACHLPHKAPRQASRGFTIRYFQLVDGISKLLLRYTLGVQFAILGFHILTKLINTLSMCHHTFYLLF